MAQSIDRIRAGRDALQRWEQDKPKSFFDSDPNLQHVLRMHLGERRFKAHRDALSRTGVLAAGPIDLLARETNRDENLPRLQRHDGIGRATEEVVHPASYHQLGELIWSTGVLEVLGEPQPEVLHGALGYLLTHNGEAGHICPVACTAGLIKLLQREGSEEQRARYLPRLLESDYSRRLHAAQFVTEVQGGSDVGLNDCVATPDPDRPGMYRVSGEKWFCSVMDAQLFVITARPQGAGAGTGGLGLFLVPRLLEGKPNGFSIRRLKVKLGTRSLATGEADFDGALAEPIGPLDRGFKNLISVVLDTSRVNNAVAACGTMRRATVEALTFARHRVAFERPILEHPMLRERVARMKLRTAAAVAATFRLLALSDRILAAEHEVGRLRDARRIHVNINKYWTAILCSEVVRDGIEVLGGNGTIEELSVLPRLYRDAMVVESWEGTHNTLCAQVLRDAAVRGLHQAWLEETREALEGVGGGALQQHHDRAAEEHARVTALMGRLFERGMDYATLHIRRVVDRMCLLNGYISLLLELRWELDAGVSSDKRALVELYRLLYIERVDPLEHDGLLPLYEQVTASL